MYMYMYYIFIQNKESVKHSINVYKHSNTTNTHYNTYKTIIIFKSVSMFNVHIG